MLMMMVLLQPCQINQPCQLKSFVLVLWKLYMIWIVVTVTVTLNNNINNNNRNSYNIHCRNNNFHDNNQMNDSSFCSHENSQQRNQPSSTSASSSFFFVQSFYIPGALPTSYRKGDEVSLKVNSMTSLHTQIPKGYYTLPYCVPKDGIQKVNENLGEFLMGNRIVNSPYVLNMLQNRTSCQKVCSIQNMTSKEASKFRLAIKYSYHNHWIVDNLPSARLAMIPTITTSTQSVSHLTEQRRYAGGFPIGYTDVASGKQYLYNHVNIHIDYHPVPQQQQFMKGGELLGVDWTTRPTTTTATTHVNDSDQLYRVVGFAVEPLSIHHAFFDENYEWDGHSIVGMNKELKTCSRSLPGQSAYDVATTNQAVSVGTNIIFTYNVYWHESSVAWSSRWDIYLSEDHQVPAHVHWYSITNSILVVLLLSALLVSILVRTIRHDIAQYNETLALVFDASAAANDVENNSDSDLESTGWKVIHADVFRPPSTLPLLYCVCLGSGSQLAISVLVAILLSAFGFLSPAWRGSLVNAFVTLYVVLGVVAGFVSSTMYQTFKGQHQLWCTILTAILFPGMYFTIFLFFNMYLYFLNSSGSVPIWDVILMFTIWFGLSIPLVFAGAQVANRRCSRHGGISYPTVTSSIARVIPTPPICSIKNPLVGIWFGGLIPFAAAYVLLFIMTSLWSEHFYYAFGYTFLVYILLIVTCSEMTILLIYYQFCIENHRWWWYAYLTAGSTAFYTFLYSIVWFQSLEASKMTITYLLYFGYMFLISFGMWLIFGTIGSLSALWFIRTIFSTIKID